MSMLKDVYSLSPSHFVKSYKMVCSFGLYNKETSWANRQEPSAKLNIRNKDQLLQRITITH